MESDSTQVTGAPIAARGPRRGAVLGERYEIVEQLDGDALGLTYKALDQESEAHVLFRLPAPGSLGERDARSLVTRLSPLVGIGGRTLARIRDVDREGSLVFVVEPWPPGTTLRAVLESRRAKRSVFSTAELLPVIVSLAEAPLAIPEPWFHGDLRAHRIYVHPEGVRITGGFALSVLPGDAIVDALTEDVGLRRQFAPEVGDGLAGRPSDRWSVAALAWEALTGAPPEPGPKTAPTQLGELGKVLVRYLDPDPTLRPTTLELLVTTLAKHAGIPAPKLVPEPFAVEPDLTSDDRTQQLDPSDLEPPTTGKSKTQSDTAKMPAVSVEQAAGVIEKAERDLSDIDPGLLKAAALNRKLSDSGTFSLDAKELEPVTGQKKALAAKKHKADDSGELDPRLVRAALGLDEGTDPRAEPRGPARASKLRGGITQELDAADLEPIRSGGAKPAAGRGAKTSGATHPAPEPAHAPQSARAGAPQSARASAPQSARPSAPQPARPSAPQPARPSAPQPARPSAPQPARVGASGPPAARASVPSGPAPSPARPSAPAAHAGRDAGATRADTAAVARSSPRCFRCSGSGGLAPGALAPGALAPGGPAPIATAPPASVPMPRAFAPQPPTQLDRPARARAPAGRSSSPFRSGSP